MLAEKTALGERAALNTAELKLLERFVERLQAKLGKHLIEVILFGSRARGERHSDSDIDVLVIVDDNGPARQKEVSEAAVEVAFELDQQIPSAKSFSEGFVKERRAIESFFIQEVDRDGIRLYP